MTNVLNATSCKNPTIWTMYRGVMSQKRIWRNWVCINRHYLQYAEFIQYRWQHFLWNVTPSSIGSSNINLTCQQKITYKSTRHLYKYKRSLKKRLLVFYKVKKITDLVSLLERLLTLYSETPRTDKDLKGFWFKEITIYTKSQETNRDSWGENPYQIAI